MKKASLFTSLIAVVCFFILSSCIELDVYPKAERCFGQELDQEDTALFRIHTKSSENKKENARVFNAKVARFNPFLCSGVGIVKSLFQITNPDGKEVFQEQLTIGASPREYRANIDVRGVYEVCLKVSGGKTPVRTVVDIEYRSRSGKSKADPSKHLNKEDLPTLEDQLKTVEDSVVDIGREIDFARRQETQLRESAEVVESRIEWFSLLSIAILASTGLWQLYYLRNFFTSKKLL